MGYKGREVTDGSVFANAADPDFRVAYASIYMSCMCFCVCDRGARPGAVRWLLLRSICIC